MKRDIYCILALIAICFTSCSSVRYTKINFKNNICDLDKGRWLVNYVDADVSMKTKQALCNSFVCGLNTIRGCSAVSIYNARWIDSTKIESSYMLSEKALKSSELRNNFDYVMNVRVNFDGQRYNELNLHTTSCSHTYTCGNQTYTHTYEKERYLQNEKLDVFTVIEVVVFDLNSGKQCYTSGVESNYSFIPVRMTTCEHETFAASLTVGIFDVITSTPPNSNNKVKRLLINSSNKILRDIKRQYRISKK